MAKPFEEHFQGIDHRRWAAEKDDSLGIGRWKLPAKDVFCDPPDALRPSSRRLFEEVVTVEV